MQAVLTLDRPVAPPIARGRRWHPGEGAVVLLLALAGYLGAGAFLVFGHNIIVGDGFSRVEIAQRILFSRDPHLAAIGFVWSPLPILGLLPLLPFKALWSSLTGVGFAGNMLSATCMALAVTQVRATLQEIGIGRLLRLGLTIAFAAHPLVLFYGANGMSEAMLLLFLLIAVRQLSRWLRVPDVATAVKTGIALAGAFLTRYEALPAVAAVVGLVVAVTLARSVGSRRHRVDSALCDAAIVGAPVFLAVLVWTLSSWMVTGHPLEQFSSIYGNTAQMQVTAGGGGGRFTWLSLAASQILVLEPFIVVMMVLGAIHAVRRWDPAPLAIVGVLGSVLTFMFWANASGAVDHQLRYSIVAVPLAVLVAGSVVGGRRPRGRHRFPAAGAILEMPRYAAGAWTRVIVLTMAFAALPITGAIMLNPRLNSGDALQLRSLVSTTTPEELRASSRFITERAIAGQLDAMGLPAGSVLVDDFLGFPILLNSRFPRQFVTTSDRDFQAILADPTTANVQYVLVPKPVSRGLLDAVNRNYPDMYATGSGMGTLVHEWTNLGFDPDWRLYAIGAAR